MNFSSAAYQKQFEALNISVPHVRASPDSFLELRWAFRSLEKNGLMDKIRRIFVVMDDATDPPNWLDLKNKKVQIVPHSSIIVARDGLPTSNLNAIMMNLHNIPDLSDWFLYSSDDEYLLREFVLNSVYNSKSSRLITHMRTHPALRDKDLDPVSGDFSNRLLEAEFGPKPRLVGSHHAPILVSKCLARLMESFWPRQHLETTLHRVSIPSRELHFQTLYQNFALDCGLAEQSVNIDDYFSELDLSSDVMNADLAKKELLAFSSKQDSQWVCIHGPGANDEDTPNDINKDLLAKWLQHEYPQPSRFEKKVPKGPLKTFISNVLQP